MNTESQPFSDSVPTRAILSVTPVDPLELLRAREAAFVAWDDADASKPRFIASLYGSYARYREEHAEYFARLKELSDAHDALTDAYMDSLRDCLAWKQAAKDAQPAAPVVVEPAVTAPVSHRIHGVVTYLNPSKGFGYIQSAAGESFYFHKANLQHSYADIRKGDTVSFQRTQYSANSQPKATMILVDGYVPAPKEAYTPPQERVTEARETVNAQRAVRRQQNAAKRENDRRNRESLASLRKDKGQAS